MLQQIWEQFAALLGLGLEITTVNSGHLALRTLVVYIFTLTIVRLGSKRFLAESTAFDVIVGIMLGSIMSRAINGTAPFVPTMVSGVVLLALHWFLAFLAYHISWFGPIVKGNPVLLIKDGKLQEEEMRKTGFSRHDLEQAVRMEANETDLGNIRLAYLERNGSISAIPDKRAPRVVSLPVQDGVQTVRIELHGD